MDADARRALVERFRERNPTPTGPGWTVTEVQKAPSLAVVDPFARFLRRARRDGFARPRSGEVEEAEASRQAVAFVERNADILGLPRDVVPTLSQQTREAHGHGSPRAAWRAHFEARFATPGYEAFELDNEVVLDVLVDDDGEVSSFVNLSRIHPHVTFDTTPALGREDPRLLENILGRRLSRPEYENGLLLRAVRREDIDDVKRTIQVLRTPTNATLTYRLAYTIRIAMRREDPEKMPYYFYLNVDADTGERLDEY